MPYVWGRTDCATLVGEALRVQFGRQIFPWLFTWQTALGAARSWCVLRKHGGLEMLCESAGATRIIGRIKGWPMGTILVLNEEEGKLPVFGISVPPVVVQSAAECGVHWCEPASLAAYLKSAWLFEQVNVGGSE